MRGPRERLLGAETSAFKVAQLESNLRARQKELKDAVDERERGWLLASTITMI